MQRDIRMADKCLKKFLRKLRIKDTDLFCRKLHFIYQLPSAGNIGGGENQRLVHRQDAVAVADDAPHIAERLPKGVAETDADVLRRVVIVHIGVALASDKKVESAVLGK